MSFPDSALRSSLLPTGASRCTKKTISSPKLTFGTALFGFSYLSDLTFCSSVYFGFLVGHLESQRRNYFSAFCWDGGMSLLWNAAWLANGVTQDGWSEATGMSRIDGGEK